MSRKSSHSALVTRTDSISNATAWHRRLGHLHPDGVISFLQHTKRPPISRQEFIGCDDCAQGKSTQSPATSPFRRSPNALDLVHSDLLGPISPPTSSGKKYILSFIDDHTRFNHIYLLSSKDETFTCFKKYKALVEKQTGRRIGKLKSDQGGEYSSTAFLQFLEEAGIQLERGPAQRPPANSVAERFFRTIMGRIRTQLLQSGLPSFLWGELATYCSLQINCSPTRALHMHIPMLEYEKAIVGHLHPFDFSRLQPFGCRTFAHQQHRSSKLQATSKSMIFVGLERGARAARLWDPITSRILVTGDISCREDVFPAKIDANDNDKHTPPTHVSLSFPAYLDSDVPSSPTPVPGLHQDDLSEPDTVDADHQPPEPQIPAADTTTGTQTPDPPDEPRRSERTRAPVVRYGFSATDQSSPEHDHPTYSQAMKGPERDAWKQACREEFDSLLQHNVGTLVDPPRMQTS